MGVLTGLVLWPLAPVRGVVWLAQQILEQADREFNDPAAIRAALDEVEEQRRRGQINSEEAAAMEDALLTRLLTTHGRIAGAEG